MKKIVTVLIFNIFVVVFLILAADIRNLKTEMEAVRNNQQESYIKYTKLKNDFEKLQRMYMQDIQVEVKKR